ncbi:MAG: hypothetical protein ABL891_04375, partial [Burkholderiales bacterium]
INLVGAFGAGAIIVGGIVFYLLKFYVPTYLSEKAKNLATREDISAITNEIERVRVQYTILVEELKARHQLRMAALDRRLQAHQEAFTLWRELFGNTHTEEVGKSVLKCQAWWEANCIYLEPKVRQGFVDAYSAAHSHNQLVRGRADAQHIQESWARIIKFPDILFEAVQLPPLTEVEVKSLENKLDESDRKGS